MPQFFCPSLAPGVVELDADESMHVRGSQRLRPGERIHLFDGRGRIAHGTIRDAQAGAVAPKRGVQPLRVEIERVQQLAPPSSKLTLVVAAPKGNRLEWMIEKCTELGVTRIVLANCERSVVLPRETRMDKLHRVARESCKQCGRPWMPMIETSMSVQDAIAADSSTLVVAEFAPNAQPFSRWLASRAESAMNVTAVIGPEGGLTIAERGMLGDRGALGVRLAECTLRVETAALACAAVWSASQST